MLPESPHGGHDVDQILEHVQRAIGERRYRHWFQGRTRLVLRGDVLRVEAASPYLLNWVQRRFTDVLQTAAREVVHPGLRLTFDVDATLALLPATDGSEDGVSLPQQAAVGRSTRPAAAAATDTPRAADGAAKSPQVRRQFDLADFVVGGCNELAYTAARQVSATPGARYSPLFIHSGVGNGKSHLAEAISRQIKRNFPSLQVLFLTAENFTNYFTRSLREKSSVGFRAKFRGCDVLIVEDVDFLEGKKSVQEEFLHTLQQLEAEGRQIVLTGDRHPRLMTKLTDELVTRFLSGLVCRIEAPSLEMRKEVVRRIAAERKLPVSTGALDFVASRFTSSIREIVGAMNCLDVWHSIQSKRIGVGVAREVLANLERDCLKIVRLDDIDRAVANLFGLTTSALKSSCRSRNVAQPRMLAMYLARRMTNVAYSDIGRHFGGRNHTTVMSAEKKIARQLELNESIRIAAENWPVRDVLQTLEQQVLAG
ncbi:MAG: chromosomal replication initiator protein DnaA [Planctomycetaceae bacterium]